MVAINEITEFAQRIGEEFKAHKVILFGSHAEDRAGRDSDVDLFIVMPFEGRRAEQAVEIYMKLRPRFPVDLIVRTPEEVHHRLEIGDSFVQDVLANGKTLYESKSG